MSTVTLQQIVEEFEAAMREADQPTPEEQERELARLEREREEEADEAAREPYNDGPECDCRRCKP